MYQQRNLAITLQKAIASFPAVLVTGPRQSGKTTLLVQFPAWLRDRLQGS